MFINGWERIYIDRNNFAELCHPTIELNGNYSGTEHGFLETLVHEMCHYYTEMDGYCPRQGHGFEFRNIGSIVTSRSNGMFTIQRLASAEQMTELELSDEMKAKRERRLVQLQEGRSNTTYNNLKRLFDNEHRGIHKTEKRFDKDNEI